MNDNFPEYEQQQTFANEVTGQIPLDHGTGNAVGVIHFANSARFIESNYSEPLTSYAVGWRDPNNIEATLEFTAPKVPVSRRFEYAEFINPEEFLSETDDIRAENSDFKRVEFRSKKTAGFTLNKGLTVRVDTDNYTQLPNWKEIITGKLMRRLLRNELCRGITILAAAATNEGKTWTVAAAGDPDAQVLGKIISFADGSGVSPNRVLYGQSAWQARVVTLRGLLTAGSIASSAKNEAELAAFLGVDQVLVSKERYQSAIATKTQLVNLIVLAFLAESGAMPEDPSNIKRFVSPTEGGTPFRVYEQQMGAHLIDISVEHYSNIVCTSTLGIQKITVTP